MMALGFGGLVYAASRRGEKFRLGDATA
jgi:hypothetical protein